MASVIEPLVSVVIPTYNHAHFLRRALESVLGQSYKNWEAVIVNNYSKDNTEEVISLFNEPRFRLINFSNNGVIAASRNEGIRQARGEFIAFLDSDDFWFPNKLEKCVEIINQTSADVITHHLVKNTNGKLGGILKNGPVKFLNYKSLLFEGNCLTNSSVVVRESCLDSLGGLNESREIITAEDYDLWLRLAQANCKFVLIDETLGEYFIHSVNNSSVIERHLNSVCAVFQSHFNKYDHPSHLIKMIRFKKRMGVIFYGAARQATTQLKFKEAYLYFIKSLSYYPVRLKTYLGIIFLLISRLRHGHNVA